MSSRALPSGRPGPILTILALCVATAAGADGAFPDSLGILLPADDPSRIYASTNFGLLVSEDSGLHWSLICEAAVGTGAFLYQVGPPPSDTLFAVTVEGLSLSSDQGCSWQHASTKTQTILPVDVFPDPSDATHVLGIGRVLPGDGGFGPMVAMESHDRGDSFNRILYTAPSSAFLTGIEVARTDPASLFITQLDEVANVRVPALLHSGDGGASWAQVNLTPAVGAKLVRLAAVDPADATRAFLRVSNADGADSLAIADQAGASVRVVLLLQRPMSAFLVRANGELLVGTVTADDFRSRDRGESFQVWTGGPHLRGLGERAGRLYAVADNAAETFAVGVSDDDGASWQPLLDFQHLCGLATCGAIPTTCATAWSALQQMLSIPDDACAQLPVRPAVRLGPSGCGCGVSEAPGALVAALVCLGRRRQGRRE